MRIFRKKKSIETEERNSNSFATLLGSSEGSGLTEESILKIPTVETCVKLISGTIAKLPIYLYKKSDNNTISEEIVKGDRRVFLLNNEPNDFLNGFNFKYNIVKDYLIHGNSYIYIDENSTTIKGLHPIKPLNVSVTKYQKGLVTTTADIEVSCENGGNVKKKPYNFIIVANDSEDGLEGKGILVKGVDVLKLAQNEIKYSQSIYENGALPLGVLKTEQRLTKEAIERLRSSWNNLYKGLKNSNKTIILEDGLDYSPMSLKPNEMQLDNSRSYVVSELCRLFNVPENLINPNTAQYSSVEQNNIHFLQYCIGAIMSVIESAINKSLLLEEEKEQGYYFAFDESDIIKTTLKEKMEALKIGVESGLYSFNEARNDVKKPQMKTDFMRFNIGQVFYDRKSEDMIIPNTGTIVNIKNKQFITAENGIGPSHSKSNQLEDEIKNKSKQDNKNIKGGEDDNGS